MCIGWDLIRFDFFTGTKGGEMSKLSPYPIQIWKWEERIRLKSHNHTSKRGGGRIRIFIFAYIYNAEILEGQTKS